MRHATHIFLSILAMGQTPEPVPTRALIEQALNEPARITLKDVTLRDAVKLLEEQTGVRLLVPQEVLGFVPSGGGTRIDHAEMANLPLRTALEKLFSPVGLTFSVENDHILVEPKAAVRCLGRAATWEELDTLAQLEALSLSNAGTLMSWLLQHVQLRVPDPAAQERLNQAVRAVGAGSGDVALSVACRNLGWEWCLFGQQIVVMPAAQRILQQLDVPVSVRLNHRPFFDVITAVSKAAGVPIHLEPGALGTLPLEWQRNFSLNAQNEPASRVLDGIAAFTGLGYLIEPDGVLFYVRRAPAVEPPAGATPSVPTEASNAAVADTAPRDDEDPIVGKIIVPLEDGRTMEWLVRRSELPPDLRDRRAADLRRAFDALRVPAGDGGS